MAIDETPTDVWYLFDDENDEDPSHEANIFRHGDGYRVEWSNVDVGQVTKVDFDFYEKAQEWLTEAGYQDFSS